MDNEISNRILAVLVIAAIIISVGGTVVSLTRLARIQSSLTTGYALSDIGIVSLGVTSTSSIRFAINSINFGAGSVNSSGSQSCTMNTAAGGGFKEDSTHCLNFNSAPNLLPLVLENDGNTNMSVNLTSSHNSTDFMGLGTPSPVLRYKVTNNESDSCGSPGPAAFQDINKSSTTICTSAGGLGYADTVDTLNIDLNITIPYNTNITDQGQQNITFTAIGTSL